MTTRNRASRSNARRTQRSRLRHMSLKAFHVVFITASILLAFGFGAWSYFDYKDQGKTVDLIYAIGSTLAGIALVIYFKIVLRKLKNISYL